MPIISDGSRQDWDWEIGAKTPWWGWKGKELWSYRHLLAGVIKREFILNYKQTILGPLWILVQPILTLLTYLLVFRKFMGLPTEGLPPVLFFLSGIIVWNLFSDSLLGSANTFRENVHVFSKVYFPRLVMPLSMAATHFLRFLMQFLLFVLLTVWFVIFGGYTFPLDFRMLLFPLILILIVMYGLGIGLYFSVLTAKYRDLGNLLPVFIRFGMFLTPIFYTLTTIPEDVRWIVTLNPLTPLLEAFRYSMLGQGSFTAGQIVYSGLAAAGLLISGMLVFNKQGDKLLDTI